MGWPALKERGFSMIELLIVMA
ncbi:MAG: type II secretion system GspH family protein, partial [Gammaproteobacteria bacterium]|nr:type II secretion system GspH family protein [Gammaproteobacteria bacterium]